MACPAAPAPGYRDASAGTLYNIGYDGHSWSSSIFAGSSDAFNLYFSNSRQTLQNINARSYAFQVRCLQE